MDVGREFYTIDKSQRGMGRCETSPFSIRLGGMHGRSAFFGSNTLAFAEKNEYLPVRKSM